MVDVYVGLGSNVTPEHHLRRAWRALGERFGPLRASSVYRNPPVGFEGDDFLNMVLAFGTDASPDAVEAVLSAIEREEGRKRADGQLGPRTLDLDLLLYGSRVDAGRRLPRDDVLRYAFVLAPLAQLAPHLRHPVTGGVIERLWRERAAAGDCGLTDVGILEECRRARDGALDSGGHRDTKPNLHERRTTSPAGSRATDPLPGPYQGHRRPP